MYNLHNPVATLMLQQKQVQTIVNSSLKREELYSQQVEINVQSKPQETSR